MRRYIDGMTPESITPRQFHESVGVEDWRVVGDGACAYFRTGSFAVGARFVQAIGELAGLDDHHPDVDLRHEGVTVRLFTVAPARQISAVARAGPRRRPVGRAERPHLDRRARQTRGAAVLGDMPCASGCGAITAPHSMARWLRCPRGRRPPGFRGGSATIRSIGQGEGGPPTLNVDSPVPARTTMMSAGTAEGLLSLCTAPFGT